MPAQLPRHTTLPASHAQASDLVARLAEALRQRQHFVVLTGAERLEVTAIIQALGTELGPNIRFIGVANPLVSPLTLSRILLQIGGNPGNSVEEDVAGVVCILAAPIGRKRQVVLVIEDADTLHRNALLFLQELPNLVPAGAPVLQVLFIASARFAAMLEQGGFLGLSTRLVHLELTRTTPGKTPGGSRSSHGKRLAWPAIAGLGLLAGIAGAGFYDQFWSAGPSAFGDPAPAAPIALPGDDQATVPSPDSLPEGTRGNPSIVDPGKPAETPTSDPPAATAEPNGRLRQEFDAFLSASGPKYAKLTEAQRELLFQQYLARGH